jgi:hypothetical protein
VSAQPDHRPDGGQTYQEQFCADERLLEGRRLVGDLLGAFNGIREAVWRECRDALVLTEGDELKARRVCEDAFAAIAALIEAAGADDSKSLRRRFRLSAAQAEKYRRRGLVLAPGLSDEDKRRQLATWGHSWRSKSWRAVHRLQRVCHLPFVTKESDPFEANREKRAAVYTDNATDLLMAVRKTVKSQRRTVRRMDIAVARVLADFRRDLAHVCEDPQNCQRPHPYAPEWSPAVPDDGPPAGTAGGSDDGEDSPTMLVEGIVTRAALKAGKIVRELPPDELDACALLFLERAGDAWLKATGRPLPTLPPCVTRADSDDLGLDAEPTLRVSAQDEVGDFSAEIEEIAPGDAEKFSASVPAVEELEFDPEPEPRGVSLADAELTAHACISVGVREVKVVFIDDTKERGAPGSCTLAEAVTTAELLERLPTYLERNSRERVQSFTVRLRRKEDTRLIQLDDCPPDVVERLSSLAFLIHATSPRNAQAWLALAEDLTWEQYEELRYRLLNGPLKATGTNGGAYGSTRWPGSLNRKLKRRYADGESPRVQLLRVNAGRRVLAAELEAAGLLAPPRPKPSADEVRRIKTRLVDPDDWPDMNQFLAECDGDRSRAESKWCVRALYMGHSQYDVEAELERIGRKASVRRRDGYVRKTVASAAAWVGLNPARETSTLRDRGTL